MERVDEDGTETGGSTDCNGGRRRMVSRRYDESLTKDILSLNRCSKTKYFRSFVHTHGDKTSTRNRIGTYYTDG